MAIDNGTSQSENNYEFGNGFTASHDRFDYRHQLEPHKGLFDSGTGLGRDVLNDIIKNPRTRFGLAGLMAFGLFKVLGGLNVDGVHAMDHVDGANIVGDLERGLVLSPTEINSGDLQIFHGDGLAIVNIDGEGAYLAPGVHLYEGEEAFNGSFVIDLKGSGVQAQKIDDGEKPPYTRYSITLSGEQWDAARMLVMSPGQRNNTLMMLHNLEKVAGYGEQGQIYIDVTPDFSGKNASVEISGISAPDDDGNSQIIDLGTDKVAGMEVFPSSISKSAVLVPATIDAKQVIIVVPAEFTNLHTGEDGSWIANGADGKEYRLSGDGSWVESKLTPEQQLDIDMREWNLNTKDYVTGYDAEGNIELRDKSGLLVYWNGRWATVTIRDMVKAKVIKGNSCDHIPFGPGSQNEDGFGVYRRALVADFQKLMGLSLDIKVRYMMEYLGVDASGEHCWGISLETVFDDDKPMDTNFAYRDDQSELHVYPVFYSQDHK
jgi:hypothetical protein